MRFSGGSLLNRLEYINVPPIIGSIIANKMATLRELQEFYGTEDAYNMLEIVGVGNYNQSLEDELRNGK